MPLAFLLLLSILGIRASEVLAETGSDQALRPQTLASSTRILVRLSSPSGTKALQQFGELTSLGFNRWHTLQWRDVNIVGDHVRDALLQMDGVLQISNDPWGTVAGVIPDDPSFGLQYGLHNTGQLVGNQTGIQDADIDAPEAWEIHKGNGLVTVAIVDTGVSYHAELAGRLLEGYNTVDHSTNVEDECKHGTHVAGVIAARANNDLGVAGVNWECNILPVRVTDGCIGLASHCAIGIVHAVDAGAQVINVSLQYYAPSAILEDAVLYAEQHDVVVVAAAGNLHDDMVAWPARYPTVLAVSATNNRDEFFVYSNFGDEIDLCAPGRDIYNIYPGGIYTYAGGTSAAAPFVSGAAALLRSFDPGLSAIEIRRTLMDSADDLGPVGWDEQFGFGRLNLGRAMNWAAQDRELVLSSTDLIAGESATLSVRQGVPMQPVHFAYTLTGKIGSTPIRGLQVALDFTLPRLAGSTITDVDGNASLHRTPDVQWQGRWVYLQALQFGIKSQLIRERIE